MHSSEQQGEETALKTGAATFALTAIGPFPILLHV